MEGRSSDRNEEAMSQEYGADQIQILEGLEAVRKRPGMYIGSTSARGLHHLVYEIVDNSIDEANNGFCDTITVQLNADGSCTVKDNGRGIPIGINNNLETDVSFIPNKYAIGIYPTFTPIKNSVNPIIVIHSPVRIFFIFLFFFFFVIKLNTRNKHNIGNNEITTSLKIGIISCI